MMTLSVQISEAMENGDDPITTIVATLQYWALDLTTVHQAIQVSIPEHKQQTIADRIDDAVRALNAAVTGIEAAVR